MNEQQRPKEEVITDARALIAKDITTQVLGRLEGLVVAELDDAGETIGRLFGKIYRAVDEAMREAESRAGSPPR